MASHSQPRALPAPRRAGEAAFTLAEILVVLLIVGIIMAIAVSSLRSSRNTGGRVEIRAVASMYADAIERYQADHGRKVPTFGGPDWPNAAAGPVRRLQIGGTVTRPYLERSIPDIVTRGGPTGVTWATSAPGKGTKGGRLVYVRSGTFGFRVDAYWDGERLCSAGDVAPGEKPC